MRTQLTLALLAFVAIPGWAEQRPAWCAAPALSDRQVKDIVARERTQSKELPAPFPAYDWVVRRTGCYYFYVENKLPPAPDANYWFVLNPHGAIVDVHEGIGPSCCLKCPDKVLSESELAAIVSKARAERMDLPPPYPKAQIVVSRQGCLYRYTEFALPDLASQTFTLDPSGELMEVTRHPAPPHAQR
jgi:hypothetical protein